MPDADCVSDPAGFNASTRPVESCRTTSFISCFDITCGESQRKKYSLFVFGATLFYSEQII